MEPTLYEFPCTPRRLPSMADALWLSVLLPLGWLAARAAAFSARISWWIAEQQARHEFTGIERA